MKNIIFAATMLITAVSFAKTVKPSGIVEYKVKEATYSSEHVQNATRAKLVLNYDKSTLALSIQVAFHCPEGRICAQVMPVPVQIELPIVAVTNDGCGIRSVTAKLDKRPADGSLQLIRVTDTSNMLCKILVEPTATYITSYYDRANGKIVTDESKMLLALIVKAAGIAAATDVLEMSLAPAILIKYVIGSGFSPNPTLKTLYVDRVGRVIDSVKILHTGKVKLTQVAQLSADALQNLNDKIATIPADAKLIDADEGEPRCTDAPTSTIAVVVQGKDVPVFERSGCHNLAVEEGDAHRLTDIMKGFLNLTY